MGLNVWVRMSMWMRGCGCMGCGYGECGRVGVSIRGFECVVEGVDVNALT